MSNAITRLNTAAAAANQEKSAANKLAALIRVRLKQGGFSAKVLPLEKGIDLETTRSISQEMGVKSYSVWNHRTKYDKYPLVIVKIDTLDTGALYVSYYILEDKVLFNLGETANAFPMTGSLRVAFPADTTSSSSKSILKLIPNIEKAVETCKVFIDKSEEKIKFLQKLQPLLGEITTVSIK
jgi:hypothetical protein